MADLKLVPSVHEGSNVHGCHQPSTPPLSKRFLSEDLRCLYLQRLKCPENMSRFKLDKNSTEMLTISLLVSQTRCSSVAYASEAVFSVSQYLLYRDLSSLDA